MDIALTQYLVTALWSSADDEGSPLDDSYSIEDIAPESIAKSEKELNEFLDQALDQGLLTDNMDITTVAHDFWLTRNHHGAGFWDGDYPRYMGEKLTELSHKFREVTPIVGDDGKIYFE
jgi:hypothetical protein